MPRPLTVLMTALALCGCGDDTAAGAGGSGGTPGAGGAGASGGAPSTGGNSQGGGGASEGGAPIGGGGGGTGGAPCGMGGAGGSAGVTCGCSPFVEVHVFANVLQDHPTGDLTISGSLCGAESVVSVVGDFATLYVQDLEPIYFTATQTDSYDFYTPEYVPDASSIGVQFLGYFQTSTLMVATDVNLDAIDPLWSDGTQANIVLETANADGATGACSGHGGVTYTVAGHPETIARYSGNGTATGPGSGDGGVQLFFTTTGTAAAPEMVTVVGTKAGCSVKTSNYTASGVPTAQSGNVPAVAGATSGLLLAVVDN